jgi:hypothetical protein
VPNQSRRSPTTTAMTIPERLTTKGHESGPSPMTMRCSSNPVKTNRASLSTKLATCQKPKTWTRHRIALVTPVLLDTSARARAGIGYGADNFAIDWKHQQITCPQGQASSSWSPCIQRGTPVAVVKFAKNVCRPCPAHAQCITGAQGYRQLTLHPRTLTETLRVRRAEQAGRDWQAGYALRAGVEGTIRQAIAVTASRRARYRGIDKTRPHPHQAPLPPRALPHHLINSNGQQGPRYD